MTRADNIGCSGIHNNTIPAVSRIIFRREQHTKLKNLCMMFTVIKNVLSPTVPTKKKKNELITIITSKIRVFFSTSAIMVKNNYTKRVYNVLFFLYFKKWK